MASAPRYSPRAGGREIDLPRSGPWSRGQNVALAAFCLEVASKRPHKPAVLRPGPELLDFGDPLMTPRSTVVAGQLGKATRCGHPRSMAPEKQRQSLMKRTKNVALTLLKSGDTTMNGSARSPHQMEPVTRSSVNTSLALPSSSQLAWPRAASTWNLPDSWENFQAERHCASADALAYVGDLATEALRHRAVKHPYLEALASGDLPDTHWALADFARQYPGYAKHFPRYLSTVISRLTNPRHRDELLENLTEESGIYQEHELAELESSGIEADWIAGRPHPQLFDRFRRAMGVENLENEVEFDQVICWRETFLSVLANGSPAEAVGALGLGTEQIVSTIYLPFTRAIARVPELSPRDSVFFPLHTSIDDHHQKTLQKIAAELVNDASTARELRRGMLKALNLRSAFWDWMYSRALNPACAAQTPS